MTATTGALVPPTARAMFHRALEQLEKGADSTVLLDVGARQVAQWSELADRVEAGEYLDGRASIYTGETYAEARDRWAAYRDLLIRHLRGPDGMAH